MANTVKNQPATEKITVQESNPIDNIQSSYEKNKKRINTIGTVVLLAVVGVFAYIKFVNEPKELKAANAIFYPQMYYQQDSLNKALNGDGQHVGFLQIIKRYGGTKAGNLANYYAGICYLQMGDAQNAVKYLKDFNGKGTNVAYAAYGALGDAYMDSGNTKEGIEYYNKAASNKEDILLTPIYLFRAAQAYEMTNQPDKAKDLYKRIRDEYPQSQQARETDRYLARLGVIE